MKDAFLTDFIVYALRQTQNTLNESTRDDYLNIILTTQYLRNNTESEGNVYKIKYRTYLDDKWYRGDIIFDYDMAVFSVQNLCEERISSDGYLQLKIV